MSNGPNAKKFGPEAVNRVPEAVSNAKRVPEAESNEPKAETLWLPEILELMPFQMEQRL